MRLIKYAQSLFQCKQLKRAALGRMATIVKRLNNPLKYLDEVRQHLGRLPSIDPNTRTLVICGYPNVGKSSFLKSISRADVDVQPYAFTTKSLFAGHFDYKYLRFQAVDTPGILDHPLEEMTTIEMQSITAIAHLRAAILYFMDLSEQCGYSVKAQCALFKSIKPLFANKICFVVINKIDVTRPEDLDAETQEELATLLKPGEVELLQASCNTQEGVQAVKNAACEKLIAERVATKLKAGQSSSGAVGSRLQEVMTRIHVARPMEGSVPLETFIPEGLKSMKKFDKNDPERRKLARDIEEENGGAGVFNVDLRADWDLANPEWKYDKIPEVVNGKNVFDYIDPDIDAKMAALEEEEERLEKDGYYDSEEEMDDDEEEELLEKAKLIREKQALIRNEARMRKSLKNRAIIPRSKVKKPLSQLADHLDQLGIDATEIEARGRAAPSSRGRSLGRAATEDTDAMDLDSTPRERLRSKSRARSQAPATDRRVDGVTDETARTKTERAAKLAQRKMNRMAKAGESDRKIMTSMPKHLVSLSLGWDDALNVRTLNDQKTVCWKAWHGQDFSSLKRQTWVVRGMAFGRDGHTKLRCRVLLLFNFEIESWSYASPRTLCLRWKGIIIEPQIPPYSIINLRVVFSSGVLRMMGLARPRNAIRKTTCHVGPNMGITDGRISREISGYCSALSPRFKRGQ